MTDSTKTGESSKGGPSEPPATPSSSVDQPVTAATVPTLPSTSNGSAGEKEDLLSRARTFLRSPQIQYQDMTAKRQFLAAKGMSEADIDSLLQEQVHAPMIPPRTYPQPPPSNLPTLLLGLVRLFSWIGIGSMGLLFVYYRWLYPRIVRTVEARRSLRSHHLSAMRKLTASLSTLKESHSESLAELPRHDTFHEPEEFAQTRSLAQVLKKLGDVDPNYTSIPPVTLLRCAIADFTKGKPGDDFQPTTEDIFLLLEGKIPWLATDEAYKFKGIIYDALLACPRFESIQIEANANDTAQQKWKYNAPPRVQPSPVIQSLSNLNAALPKSTKDEPRSSVFQHTLQALSDFTGYISSNVYVPYRPPGGMGISSTYGLSPAEEALKKEIRALKGLVLNRKTFIPSIPRPPSFQGRTSLNANTT